MALSPNKILLSTRKDASLHVTSYSCNSSDAPQGSPFSQASTPGRKQSKEERTCTCPESSTEALDTDISCQSRRYCDLVLLRSGPHGSSAEGSGEQIALRCPLEYAYDNSLNCWWVSAIFKMGTTSSKSTRTLRHFQKQAPADCCMIEKKWVDPKNCITWIDW